MKSLQHSAVKKAYISMSEEETTLNRMKKEPPLQLNLAVLYPSHLTKCIVDHFLPTLPLLRVP